MSQPPYHKAQRVFAIVDNGSAHRGQRSIDRLQGTWKNLVLVHTPLHASWLNQAEIYFSVTQRKVLSPNNFPDLDTLEHSLLDFGRHYEQIAAPFEWKFTRQDLHRLLDRLNASQPATLRPPQQTAPRAFQRKFPPPGPPPTPRPPQRQSARHPSRRLIRATPIRGRTSEPQH